MLGVVTAPAEVKIWLAVVVSRLLQAYQLIVGVALLMLSTNSIPLAIELRLMRADVAGSLVAANGPAK